MSRLKTWQWIIVATPIASIVIFLLIAAGQQIHQWGINWIWGVFTLVFVGWRWLLVKWTQPVVTQMEAAVAEVNQELVSESKQTIIVEGEDRVDRAETALQEIFQKAQTDRPIWEDWQTFWQRCQELVAAIAYIYYPEDKYPLLNIYIPQAYSLIRGTVDAMDLWMQKLSPALNQVSIGQAYQAYEVYQKLEPSARKLWQAWNWAQWLFNPAAAAARQFSMRSNTQADRQLLVNLSQLWREAALRNLSRQAIALYGNKTLPVLDSSSAVSKTVEAKTQTLRDILIQAEPQKSIEQKPINILVVGRTGSGKSSLINTLFQHNPAKENVSELAAVDVLPSTDRIQSYQWQTSDGEKLILWDTPGYEQVNRADLRQQVLEFASKADLLLLVTPALDPALQMDLDFLTACAIATNVAELATIVIVTQVDRLRPIREWQPPYNWQWGDRPKEIAIREASQYRAQLLGDYCQKIVPVVTEDLTMNRVAWGVDALALELFESIAPAKQLRLARFLNDRETRIVAAAKIIDRYTLQMATTQGLTAMLKSPILQYLSTLSTGSPTLAYLLAEKIPVEQLPIVIGKLQMAYDLFSLFNTSTEDKDRGKLKVRSSDNFDLQSLWALLMSNSAPPDRNAWAFGHALVEYWAKDLTIEQLSQLFENYLQGFSS